MSRPIFSRPRTRVYGCNYDKGESYYKPMVDHLDRKYSGRPLFPEPRTSFADEIAARRSDIGSRDLSGPRSSFARDLDLEFDTPRPSRTQAQNLYEDDEDTVYDIRGQRTNRRNLAEDFASEVASTTRRFKSQSASLSHDMEHYDDLRRSEKLRTELNDKFIESAKSAIDDADAAFKRRSLMFNEEGERSSPLTKWSKFKDIDTDLSASSAASRAKQTKARLNDLETEMEEMAERQAKRERRAAALRAMVNEAASEDDYLQETTAKKFIVKSTERAEKHVSF